MALAEENVLSGAPQSESWPQSDWDALARPQEGHSQHPFENTAGLKTVLYKSKGSQHNKSALKQTL